MPYSESQRKLAGIALSMKRGETKHAYSAQAYKMMREMSTEELRDMASGPIKKAKSKK